jgi:glycosyltransferase involved in cell wall biosynthesis
VNVQPDAGSSHVRPVAVVVSQLGYGGAERQTLALLKELRGTVWAPRRVICLSDNVIPYGAAIQELGYPLAVIPRMGGFDLRRSMALRRQLLQDGIVIVHAVNWLAAAYSLVAAPRGARVVTSIRNSRMPSSPLRRLLLRHLLRRSAAVLVNSERAHQLLHEECRIPVGRLTLVRNGMDLEHLHQSTVAGDVRRELSIPAEAPLVAYVGRNAKVKNIPRLLRVTRQLLAERRDLHVVIAGEALDRRIILNTDLEAERRLHCLGARQDVPSLLRDASVLILTSDSEGMPNVVLEALAMSLPVVATAVGDLPSALPSGCGALVEPDAERLAQATLEVLSREKPYRRAVAFHAKEMASAYSLPAMVVGTTGVWKQAAEHVSCR